MGAGEGDDPEDDRGGDVPWIPAVAGVAYAAAVGVAGVIRAIDPPHLIFLDVPLIFSIPWLFERVTVSKDGVAFKSRKIDRQITRSLEAASKVDISPVTLPTKDVKIAALPLATLSLRGNLTALHLTTSDLLRDLALEAENELRTLARLARMPDDKASLFLVIDLSDQHIVPSPLREPLLAFLEAANAVANGTRSVSADARSALLEYGPDLIEKLRALRRSPEPLVYALQLRIRSGGDYRAMGGLLSPPSIKIENTTIRIVTTPHGEVPDDVIDIFVERPKPEVVASPPYSGSPWGFIDGPRVVGNTTARALVPALFDGLISD